MIVDSLVMISNPDDSNNSLLNSNRSFGDLIAKNVAVSEECQYDQSENSQSSSMTMANDLERKFKNTIVIGTNYILIEFLSVNFLATLKIKLLEIFMSHLNLKLKNEGLNLNSNSVETIYTYLGELHEQVIININRQISVKFEYFN